MLKKHHLLNSYETIPKLEWGIVHIFTSEYIEDVISRFRKDVWWFKQSQTEDYKMASIFHFQNKTRSLRLFVKYLLPLQTEIPIFEFCF